MTLVFYSLNFVNLDITWKWSSATYLSFCVNSLINLSHLYQQSQCKYKFYLDKEHSTQEIEGTRNPDFDHSEMISCKTVTQQVRFLSISCFTYNSFI